MSTPQNLRAIGDRIEQLIDELAAVADPRVRDRVDEVLRLVTELYGAGLARIVELAEANDASLLRQFAGDGLVASLLLVHGLHPDGVAERVEGALAQVRPLLAAHAGDVELLDIDLNAGAVYLRLLGSCDGCPSSAATLQDAVERAIVEAAPEITRIDVEAPSEAQTGTPVFLIPKPTYDECPVEVGAL